ncbi:hypothetical protein OHA79_06480 [Streptomyces sp. NBC_00841]|uniref:hypothetical protein n=1 Tax=unclassified Streptomyces TaxID=2593676 RepID=UPI0022507895|nr:MULTISPECIES: hypothetical protein [unclassified Streptomyces]MCX4537226.1 hypothetical protein [Streptomyces sp. NBC_01669]WRZ97542.1 hypothetical protein OHA79_06480 [Streptomyces sp. NBC_00841]
MSKGDRRHGSHHGRRSPRLRVVPSSLAEQRWARLERTSPGDLFHFLPGRDDAEVQSTADAQTNGIVDPAFSSGDVLNIVPSTP